MRGVYFCDAMEESALTFALYLPYPQSESIY